MFFKKIYAWLFNKQIWSFTYGWSTRTAIAHHSPAGWYVVYCDDILFVNEDRDYPRHWKRIY